MFYNVFENLRIVLICAGPDWGGGQNFERRNLERPIFRNCRIVNIKITKDELFDRFIMEFIF